MQHLLKLLFLTLPILACDPKKDPQPENLDFSCIQRFSANGFPEGLHGGCTQSSDWHQIALTSEESGFLTFADTVGVAGTVAAGITELAVFPNPVMRDGPMGLILRSDVPDQPVKIKIAIIDEDKNVLKQYSLRTATNQAFQLRFDADTYTSGQHYRVYYRASSEGQVSLFEGYGNILVCKQLIITGLHTIESDCL